MGEIVVVRRFSLVVLLVVLLVKKVVDNSEFAVEGEVFVVVAFNMSTKIVNR